MKNNKEHRPLKIAVFSGTIPSTTFIEKLITELSKHHKILLFGVKGKVKKYDSTNIKVYDTPKSHFKNLMISLYRVLCLLIKNPKAILILYKEVKKYQTLYRKWIWVTKFLPIVLYKPDILHIQWAKNLPHYFFLKSDFNIKIVLSLRGAHINYSPIVNNQLAKQYKNLFPKIDGFHAVSKAIAKESEIYGAKKEKVKVIYSIVSDLFFKAYKTPHQSKNKKLKIVTVGRPHWIKGYRYALEAMQVLKEKNIDFCFDIIGIDKQQEELLYQIHQSGLKNYITLLPKIKQTELIERLKAYDVFLLSSLKEGIANVVLEAMALGLPVISTNCGGMNEVIIHNKTGFLVPIRDKSAIAEALITFNNLNVIDKKLIIENAHLKIKEQFKIEEITTKFCELYDSIMDQ